MRQAMSILTDTAPQRIWLCVSDETDDYNTPYPELYAEDAEITWSTDQPVAVTVEYVRADLSDITKLRAERDALREEVSLRRHSMPSEYAKLLAERDALAARHERALIAGAELREERDALAVLLIEARATLPDMRHTDRLCARIDAALAKGKA